MDLLEFKSNYRSQYGEDGIIKKIFEIIGGPKNKYFVEFGAWDGEFLSNTYNLYKNYNWSGCYIEGDKKKFKDLTKRYDKIDHIEKICAFVESGNNKNSLSELLKKSNAPKKFDLLSIDIDGNDYNVWKDFIGYDPTLVIIEYNQTIPYNVEFIDHEGESYIGSSCLSLIKLGKQKGYELICCTESNCFFVKKELYHLFNIEDNSSEKLQIRNECYVILNYSGELVFSNESFFPNKIRKIVYQRVKKRIKHLFFGKKSHFYLERSNSK